MIFQIVHVVHHAKCAFKKINNSWRLQTRAQRNTNKELKNNLNTNEWIPFRITQGVQIYKNKNKNLPWVQEVIFVKQAKTVFITQKNDPLV